MNMTVQMGKDGHYHKERRQGSAKNARTTGRRRRRNQDKASDETGDDDAIPDRSHTMKAHSRRNSTA
jgi:hypothetical protein